MGKGVSLQEMMDRLPEPRRRKVEARAAELIAEEMTLRDLRRAMGQTQAALASRLRMKQENVSRVEQRADMLLSTLVGYVDALGGRLRLVAEFEGRPPVHLSTLTDVIPTEANAGRPPPRSAAKTQAPASEAPTPKQAPG